MVSHRLHGSTTAIIHLSLVLWFSCSSSWGKRPSECDPPTSENPMSFLWSVRRNPPSYFFGTIHVPYSRVWDYIPENTKRAFELAENIFFELDLTDPYTINALSNCQLLPHGENLADLLPRDIYRRLKRHLDYVKGMMPLWMTSDQRGRGLYADYLFNAITGNWERKRPVWVMLMVNSLTENDIRSRGIPVLDLYLAQQAERMNKPSGAVERVEEQCVPLNGLNVSQVLFALNQTLFQHESIRAGYTQVLYTTDDLIKHYNCGDLNAVIFNQDAAQVPNLINTSLPLLDQITARKIDDYFKDELIFKRNRRMGERVIQLLLSHPEKSFFFAFGAGHFLGNNTVLDMLREAGFAIDHIPADRRIKSTKRRLRGPIGLLPEFRALRDFSLASNSLDDQSSEERTYVHLSHNPRKRMHKKLMPPRSASVPPHRKHRNFNDLWVRLDSATTSPPMSLPQHTESKDSLIVQRSLRVWYGLPANSAISLYRCVWNVWLVVLTVTTLSLYTSLLPVFISIQHTIT